MVKKNTKKLTPNKEQKFVGQVKAGKFAAVKKVPLKYIRIATVAQPYEIYQVATTYHGIGQ